MNLSRRVDIDSLRAISVISVIIFHLDKTFFPNGYLGVDLFFVISGYLITNSIFKDYKIDKFSFLNFYLKRVRRILPALLFVLTTASFFGIFILLNGDLQRFSESLLSSLGFVSNFYFWLTGGYFSINDGLKPLLHLWSLSVEEQFYIFFPIFLYLIFKFSKKIYFYLFLIFLISIASYGINLLSISKGHSDAIFFLFPARIWQFGMGAFFAVLPKIKIKNFYFDATYYILALSLIIFNFIKIIDFIPSATLMSVGAALILYRKLDDRNVLSYIFKFKPIIFTGIISYSLYLWHWPIITFYKYVTIDSLTILQVTYCLLAILILSLLTWKFIEEPFLKTYSKSKLISFVVLSYLFLIILSLTILNFKNFPSRFNDRANNFSNQIGSIYQCSFFQVKILGDSYGCTINDKIKKTPELVLFGNSHAQMYGWSIKERLIKLRKQGLSIPLNHCLPFPDLNHDEKCLKKSRIYLENIINDNKIKIVIIGFTWQFEKLIDRAGNLVEDFDYTYRKNSINELLGVLKKNNKSVYLIGPIATPQKQYLFPSRLIREIAFNKRITQETYSSKDKFEKNYKEIIKYYEDLLGDNFIQPHKELCDSEKCYFIDNKSTFFADDNHLSFYGNQKVKNLFNIINFD
jgi:peptidoglycan/LPS O-acetylase OafA/YrhL